MTPKNICGLRVVPLLVVVSHSRSRHSSRSSLAMFSWRKSAKFQRIVLASASPRRKEILINKGGLKDLIIRPSTYEEESKGKIDPSEVYNYVTRIALGKVEQVAQAAKQTDGSLISNTLFIGCDTVVLQNGQIFEKPVDKEDAIHMLKRFRDTVNHQVCSGVVLLAAEPKADGQFVTHTFHETTDVTFGTISDEVIEKYVDTGEPMDKAGGYGIQGLGAQLVHSIHGDYYNVMGFPLYRLCKEVDIFAEKLDSGQG